MRRVVTNQEVGVLSRHRTRRAADRQANKSNAQPRRLRAVEYIVRRRGFMRYHVVAYQAKLLP